MPYYFPFTYWAQDVNTINLRIDLIRVENYQLSVICGGRVLMFYAKAYLTNDDRGLSEFAFELPLAANVLDSFEYIRTDRNLNVTLKKQTYGFWKNGILDPEFKHRKDMNWTWLKFNFDKWKDDPDDIEENDVDSFFDEEDKETKRTHFEKLLKQLENRKDENISKMKKYYEKAKMFGSAVVTIIVGIIAYIIYYLFFM